MQLSTNTYRSATGWAAPLPDALDSPQTLVLVFGAPELQNDARPFAALAAAFGQSVLVGCSTAGEMAAGQVHDASLSLAVARFAHTRLRCAVAEVGHADASGAAGAHLAAQLRQGGDDLAAVFVLSDGLGVNGTPLVAALAGGLGAGVSITGGLAGDGSRFERTWVLVGAQARPGWVVAVGLYGQRLRVGRGCEGGWLDFGPERRITRSRGHVLYELDGKPALDLYKTYLGELAAGLPGAALRFPLSIRRPGSTARPLVRTILAVDEAQRSLTFAGDMPEGHVARLMRTTNDSLIDSAAQATTQAIHQARPALALGGDALVVSVSCVGRRLVLGERAEEELESVLDGAPAGPGTGPSCRVGHVGFYSYGEISPGPDGGPSELHNQTMTVTAFSEH